MYNFGLIIRVYNKMYSFGWRIDETEFGRCQVSPLVIYPIKDEVARVRSDNI